jgi:hypothetical protein
MTSPTLAQGDEYFFRGDINKWKKFANGMKARIYHRYQKKSTYLSKEVDSVIKYAGLAMQSTLDDASVKFNLGFAAVESKNFFGPLRNNWGSFRMGLLPMGMMTGTATVPGSVYGNMVNDPRVRYMMRPSPDGTYRGIEAGRFADNPTTPTDQRVPSFWGAIGQTAAPTGGVDTGARTFFRNDAPSMMMTYSEMQFVLAEAYLLKGLQGEARTAYIKGIEGHFEMLNEHYFGYLNPLGTNSPALMTKIKISPADMAAYTSNPAFVPPAGSLTLKHVMCQKYLSLWGWGYIENWVDMRRYNYDETIYVGFKKLDPIALYPDNGGKLAERVRPRFNSEYLWNVDALAAVGGFDQNYHTKKCWFSLP